MDVRAARTAWSPSTHDVRRTARTARFHSPLVMPVTRRQSTACHTTLPAPLGHEHATHAQRTRPNPPVPFCCHSRTHPVLCYRAQLAVSSALFRPAEPRSTGTLSCGDSPPAVTRGRHVASRHDPGGRAAPVPRALDIREARRARRATGRAAAEAEQARPAQGVKRLPKVRQPCSQRTHLSTHSSTPPPPCPPPGR